MAHYESDLLSTRGYTTHPYYTYPYHTPSVPTYVPRQRHAPYVDPRLRIDEHFDTLEEAEELRAFIRTIVRKRKRHLTIDEARETFDDLRKDVLQAFEWKETGMYMTDCKVHIEKLPAIDTGQSRLNAM
jgi:hypothetical protein